MCRVRTITLPVEFVQLADIFVVGHFRDLFGPFVRGHRIPPLQHSVVRLRAKNWRRANGNAHLIQQSSNYATINLQIADFARFSCQNFGSHPLGSNKVKDNDINNSVAEGQRHTCPETAFELTSASTGVFRA